MKDNVVVSVICLAYNHEKYIKRALDSILNQKTDFCYEILVHDDCSTDKTQEIIKNYAEKYQQIIIPYFETENQYSKGKDVVEITFSIARGKYIAFCECDDYWSDVNKLQRQVDFLESHSEYSACAASCMMINETTGAESELFHTDEDIDFSVKDIVQWDDRHYQTASLIFRREYTILPEEFYMLQVGDYPRAIYLMSKGKFRYFKDVMSVYRVAMQGSWTSSLNKEKLISLYKETILMLNKIRKILNSDFQSEIENKIESCEYEIFMIEGNYSMLSTKFKPRFMRETRLTRIKVLIKGKCPNLYGVVKKLLV